MSTSLLYHAFGIVGYFIKARFIAGVKLLQQAIIAIEMSMKAARYIPGKVG
ncbi:MAG: hypothetical protein IPH22_04360 [Nitrosomonas sp.]|nr:hypothetical protein [Nitrosomonas sp.]